MKNGESKLPQFPHCEVRPDRIAGSRGSLWIGGPTPQVNIIIQGVPETMLLLLTTLRYYYH